LSVEGPESKGSSKGKLVTRESRPPDGEQLIPASRDDRNDGNDGNDGNESGEAA
jgi:hypothetical protein